MKPRRTTLDERCAALKLKVEHAAAMPTNQEIDSLPEVQKRKPKVENVSVKFAADYLGWCYKTTLRHFERVQGVTIKPGLNGGRRKIDIPEDVFWAEVARLRTRKSVEEVAIERLGIMRAAKRLKTVA